MSREFERALANWEAGGLSRDELARRFPGEDVGGLLTAFERMQAAATGPTPDPADAWDAIRPQLPVRLAHRRKRTRVVRLLAAALVALLAMGATAYALVPGVRRAVSAAFGSVMSSDEGSPGPTAGTVGPIRTYDPDEREEPGSDDTAPDEDEVSSGTDGRTDDENDEQGEDPAGTAQGEDEDDETGSGEGTGDEKTSGGDQAGTQDAGSQQVSDVASQDGADQDGHDTDQVDQAGDGNSGN